MTLDIRLRQTMKSINCCHGHEPLLVHVTSRAVIPILSPWEKTIMLACCGPR